MGQDSVVVDIWAYVWLEWSRKAVERSLEAYCQGQVSNIKKIKNHPKARDMGSNFPIWSLLNGSNCLIWSFMQSGTIHCDLAHSTKFCLHCGCKRSSKLNVSNVSYHLCHFHIDIRKIH